MTAEAEAKPFEQFIAKRQITSLAIVFANNSWGETQRVVYSRIAELHNVKIVDSLKPAGFDENDVRDLVLKVKVKQPDSVLLLLNKNDISLFLRRSSEVDLDTKFFASKNAFDAVRLASKGSLFEGLCFTYPLARLKSTSSFAAQFKEKFGEEPRIYADNTYDALMLLHKAFLLSDANSTTLKDSLRTTTTDGLVGTYSFNGRHSFSIGDSSLVCIKDGVPVVVH